MQQKNTEENQKKQENFQRTQKFLQELFNNIGNCGVKKLKEYFFELENKVNIYKQIKKNEDYKDYVSIEKVINDCRDGKGKTCMHFACARGNIEVVKLLIDLKGSIYEEDNENNPAFFIAVQHSHLELLKYIIQTLKVDINFERKNGAAMIHLASQLDNIDILQYLLSQKANINQSSPFGTPLQWAICFLKNHVVKFLLQQEDIQVNSDCEIPPPLILAIDQQNEELFESLLQVKGIDVNATDLNKESALHVAAEKGTANMIQQLINKGADKSYKYNNQTILETAKIANQWNNYAEIRKILNLPEENIENIKQQTEKEQNIIKEREIVNQELANELKTQGNQLFSKEQYKEALEKYKKSIEQDQSIVQLYSNSAACLIKLGLNQEALEMCQKARKCDSNFVKTYFREGQAYQNLENYGDAAASFWEAWHKEPKNLAFKKLFEENVERGKQQHQQNI